MSYIQDYNETIGYLYELRRHGIKLGLRNTEKLMGILGEPHKSFHSIHVAGTNGKGSTAAIIASILKESGFKVGLFTSPHLVSFTERIRVNNKEISEHEVVKLANEIRNIMQNTPSLTLPPRGGGREWGGRLNPTFFEFVTAMAFLYFKRKKVDWAVVEVGMGGRFDATNVINPIVSAITNVGLEHKEFLGESISEIAFEKAGIIKHAVPVVSAVTQPEALAVIEKTVKSLCSEIYIYGRDFKGETVSADDNHIIFDYSGMKASSATTGNFRNRLLCNRKLKNLFLPLAGKHQIFNASVAIRVCEILKQKGFFMHDNTIIKGLARLTCEGRLEWLCRRPPIIIDSAHNPDAAKILTESIKELFNEKKFILVAGIMKDKDIAGILNHLSRIPEIMILTQPKGERTASAENLKYCLKKLIKPNNNNNKLNSIITTNTVSEAMEYAKSVQKDHIILVTGSFYTTGEVKELLSRSAGVLSQLRE